MHRAKTIESHRTMTTRFSSNMIIALALVLLPFLTTTVHGQCTICPDGSASFNEGKIIPLSDVTCGDFQGFVQFAGDTEACDAARAQAAWCECPGVEPTCELCPDGTYPVNAGMRVDFQFTCGDYFYLAQVQPEGTDCTEFNALAMQCGGCGDPPPTSSPSANPDECDSLCPDGSEVPNPTAIVFEGDENMPVTCSELEFGLQLGFFPPGESCLQIQLLGVTQCGCPDTLPDIPEDASCKLCEDGSAPPDLDYEVIPDFSCRLAAYQLAFEEGDNCTAIQATAGVYCGCDNPIATQDVCRICGDSLMPDPSRIIDPDEGIACGEIEYDANTGESTCSEAQDAWADFCCATEAPSAAPSLEPTISLSPSAEPSQDPTASPVGRADSASHVFKLDIIVSTICLAGVAMALV